MVLPQPSLDFAVIVLVSVVASAIAVKLRWPPVILFILAGAVIGPNILGVIGTGSIIEFFAEIGAVLLLFIIGVEFNIARMVQLGARALTVGLIEMSLIFLVMYEVAIWSGFGMTSALAIASVFSFASTAILMRMLGQLGLNNRQEVPLLLSVLIIQDLVGVFVITFFSALKHFAHPDVEQLLFSFVTSVFVLVFSYVVAKRLLNAAYESLMEYKNEETLVFFSLFLGVTFSLFATFIGLSPAIGAFLAGSMAASLQKGKELEEAIRPFYLTFSALFFISIGMMINLQALTVNMPLILFFLVAYIICAFFIIAFTTYVIGFSSESAVFSGASMLVLGEFSLLIARESVPFFSGFDIVGMVSVAVLVTSFFSFQFLGRLQHLNKKVKSAMPSRLKQVMMTISYNLGGVLSEFEPGGAFFEKLKESADSVYHNILITAVVLIGYMLAKQAISPGEFSIDGLGIAVSHLLVLLCILLMLKPVVNILSTLKSLVDILSRVLIEERLVDKENRYKLALEASIVVILLLVTIYIPAAIYMLKLPPIFRFVGIVPLLLILFILWDILKTSSKVVHGYINNLMVMKALQDRIRKNKK